MTRVVFAYASTIRNHLPYLLYGIVGGISNLNVIVVRLTHLLPVHASHERCIGEARLGLRKIVDLAQVIESPGYVASKFQMSFLILANWNQFAFNRKNIGGLQYRVAQ